MPFVRIHLKRELAPERRRAIADAVHSGLITAIGIPADDRFQVISSHGDDLIYDAGYLGIARTDDVVLVEVHLSVGRSLELKRALYRAIADNLSTLGIRGEDVFVHLMETTLLNWSFGRGEAQYADRLPTHVQAAQ